MLRRTALTRGVAFCLVVFMAACSTWRPYTLPSPPQTELPGRVRLTLQGGGMVTLTDPYLEGDSVWAGLTGPTSMLRVPASRVAGIEASEAPGEGAKVLGFLSSVVLVAAVAAGVGMSRAWGGS